MKTISTIVCLAALLSGCSHENREPNTAYENAPRGQAEESTVTRIPNKPVPEVNQTPSERAQTAAPETDHYTGTGERGSDALQVAPATPGATSAAEPDNTRVNRRDRDGDTMTPMDQGSSESDRAITAEIRKAVVGDGTLSFTAKNVKIITKDGNVVLRGPVKNEEERAAIRAKAARVAGASRVTDQLEVAK